MRVLHTMIRVGDLERSIQFYTEVLGMKLLRRKDYPDGKFTLAFIGYGPESEHAVIELTHNWDTARFDLGDGFGHVALEVDDAYAATVGLAAQEVAAVQAQVRRRVLRWFVRGGWLAEEDRREMQRWAHSGGFSVDAAVH